VSCHKSDLRSFRDPQSTHAHAEGGRLWHADACRAGTASISTVRSESMMMRATSRMRV